MADAYERHYRTEVLETLQGVPGFVERAFFAG